MKILIINLKVIFVLFFSFFKVLAQDATINEIQKSLKTYPFSDPNPVARPGHIYPYFRFDGFTDKAIMQNWKFVELENQFIKVSVTPEIGGKVWGAYEKSSNFPFVYFNNVVKFRDIAMRGPYTSGGIEMNFGDIGHDPTVANPVDYFNRKNADGSVSCFVGAYDWASRTRWMVEVNLPKDKAYFKTKTRWFNASPLDQTNYQWMNAGFRAAGDLEFTFPGTNFIGHGGELDKWPINNDGKQINFYEKNNFGSYKSYHVLGSPADFYGGYWHKNKVGFVHYSPYHEKLGRKIWVWGHSRQGMMWEDLLTDTDGQYVELQSGRLFNQAGESSDLSPFKHVAFQPYGLDKWSETWYPVKNIGGISQGASWGAWKISKNKNWTVLAISPAEAVSDSLIFINNGIKTKKFLQLNPLESYKDSIEINENNKLEIFLGNKLLYSYNTDNKQIERPLEAPKDFDWNTEYGMFMKAKGLANQRRYADAEDLFSKLLIKNKYHVPALGEMAQLSYRKGNYKEAMNNAKTALSINTYDPLGNYMLGLASLQTQNIIAAKDAFGVAVLTSPYRAAALVELAKIAIAENDLEKANLTIIQALEANPQNEHAKHLRLVYFRKSNNIELANKEILELLQDNPLDHQARIEAYFLSKKEEDKNAFISFITNELAYENYIELALWYREINDLASAKIILSLAPYHTLARLWEADITKDESMLNKALEMSPEFVFPFRHEEHSMLKRLIDKNAKNDNSWKLNYYYGLILRQNGYVSETENQFNLCANKPNSSTFYLTKAEIFEKNKDIVQQSLEKAHDISPDNWRVSLKLSDFHIQQKSYATALRINEKTSRKTQHEVYLLDQQKATILEKMGNYQACLIVLDNLTLLPSEIAPYTHDLYRKVNLEMAINLIKSKRNSEAIPYINAAKTWPEKLGSGEPYESDNQLADALSAYINDNNMKKLKVLSAKLSKDDLAVCNKLLK